MGLVIDIISILMKNKTEILYVVKIFFNLKVDQRGYWNPPFPANIIWTSLRHGHPAPAWALQKLGTQRQFIPLGGGDWMVTKYFLLFSLIWSLLLSFIGPIYWPHTLGCGGGRNRTNSFLYVRAPQTPEEWDRSSPSLPKILDCLT